MAEIIAQNSKKSGKLLMTVIVVVVVLVLAYFVWQSLVKNQGVPLLNNPEIVSSGNKLPDGFLSGLPIESNVEFKESYTASYPKDQSRIQKTISYYSSKDLAQAFKSFTDYIDVNGWVVLNKTENSTMKFIYAQKGNNELNISLAKDEIAQKVLVTISYLESK